ncbi:DUF3857 domain-containing protein [Altererythrobacter lutimaris]|uniref:DUF3857 domain-containing protein n=1 Tax=Altererythrobacter lutimaris TaxID=2743979 RepID=A0A850H8D1_9SPHN|nr:DUF3857 domain-containing protein [Altererythrobacter lutimaris]NVE93790.1 DUF3857 domain-containing protein [Altererythrobacter lutimaris]
MKLALRALLTSTAAVCLTSTAWAGEGPLYADAPDWVDEPVVTAEDAESTNLFLLLEQQARLEDGLVSVYSDFAVELTSPEALTQFGTLNAAWQPDKGDLIVHRAELLRDGETINLLENEEKFDVLRRERQLERRTLDGVLTATMPLTGAQVGDVLRLSYTVTNRDQALGEEMQWQTGLIAEPVPLEKGSITVSWPVDEPIQYGKFGDFEIGDPVERDGYMYWRAEVPIAKPDDRPSDAPARYRLTPRMLVTSFQDWPDVSSSMAPHYDITDSIAEGGDLAAEIAKIAATTDDPMIRMAMATELVQDEISYLHNGLNGGNYLPQMPEETWEKRFGDCKAKSVLLHAVLQELGITSEVVLVASQGGDALAVLTPLPGNFDHMIVRAEVNGVSYWIDGTTSGTRLDTIDTVPRFHYALPIRADGSDLLPMDVRPQANPDQTTYITMDQRAGLLLPAMVDVKIEFRGSTGAQWRTVVEQEGEIVEDAISSTLSSTFGSTQFRDEDVTYDEERGVATLTAKGLMSSPWSRERRIYEFSAPAEAARTIGFGANRARADWRDIPLSLNGPIYHRSELELLLPDETSPFTIKGDAKLAETIGAVELGSNAELSEGRYILSQSMRTIEPELPADQLRDAKRGLNRFTRALPTLRSGQDVRELWEYSEKDADLIAPILAFYDAEVADAEEDDEMPLFNRADFHSDLYNFEAALADIEAAMEVEASRELYDWRSWLKVRLGDLEGALEDFEMMEELQPDGSTYESRIEVLALLDRADEGLELAEDYRGLGSDEVTEDVLMAIALGWAGDAKSGLELLEAQREIRPGDGNLLNNICWHAATNDIVTDELLATCTEAVEKGNYAANVLDSRAFAHYRMGNLEAAKADLDSALLLKPDLAGSRLLRGIVMQELGDKKEGKDEVKLGLKKNPMNGPIYKAWGLKF